MPREVRTIADLPEAQRIKLAQVERAKEARQGLTRRKANGTVTRAEFNQLLDAIGIPENQGNP